LKKLEIIKAKWMEEQVYCDKCDMPNYWSMTEEQRDFYEKNGKEKTIQKFFNKKHNLTV
jgi:hypothetical protein